jgi:hypothetical protein
MKKPIIIQLISFVLTTIITYGIIQILEPNPNQAIQSNVLETERKIDSLETELFQAQSINGRYELAVEHLYETNPSVAREFDEYFNNETE